MEQASKGMMKELEDAKLDFYPSDLNKMLFNQTYIRMPEISKWYENEELSGTKGKELQLKLIKHIWLNEPQFEVEKPKKYVVRTKQMDNAGDFRYLALGASYGLTYPANAYAYDVSDVEKFDTREEAEKWTNPLMEVVEVEE